MTTEPRIVLITGGNKGIGLATARHLATDGHTVVIGSRDAQRGERARAELAADGLNIQTVPLDVTDQSSVDRAAMWLDDQHGRLDVLVNNAGISRDHGRAPQDLPVSALREIYETNVFGVVAVTNAMVPLLRRSSVPHIGNVGSGLGTFAVLAADDLPDYVPMILGYNSSKAALNMITVIYARALAADGIKVNGLSPGYVATDLNRFAGHDTVEQGGARIATQAIATPDTPTGVFFNENGGTYPW